MRNIFALLILLAFVLSLTSCGYSEPKEITCDELIAVYEDAGYLVLYHGHEEDESYHELGMYCCFEIRDPDNEDSYMYVHRYFNEDDAKAACEERQFNVVLWLFFGIFGEWRWLHVGYYGNIEYETFDYKMILPLRELILCGR